MKPVAILGTGPAGLLAAWAVAQAGHPVALFGAPDPNDPTRINRSKIGGAQFLHEPIPGLTTREEPHGYVDMLGEGDAETYRRKVYGEGDVPFVSFRHDVETVPVWQMGRVYGYLWTELSAAQANVVDVTPSWLDEAREKGWFKAVISSVPAPALCRSVHAMPGAMVMHQWQQQEIAVADFCIVDGLADNTVLYDGTVDRSWYRCAKLFGIGSTEWSTQGPKPPLEEDQKLVTLTKPIATTCDCHPEVMRVGRMGQWRKGVLAHHAYEEVVDALH